MGSVSFTHVYCHESATKAFDLLTEAMRKEFGEYSYNGTISTCHLVSSRPRMKFDKYSKSNEKKALDFIKQELAKDKISKRECAFVDLGVTHYEVITVQKESSKKSVPVWKKMFVVYYSHRESDEPKAFSSKREAEAFAMKKKLENIENPVCIKNEYVLTKGDSTVEKLVYKKVEKKTKPNLKAMPNRIVKEIHKFIFYGYATE